MIQALGGDPVDVLFQLIDANNGSIPTIYFHHSENDMRYALQQPFVSIGSDGTAVKTEGPLARGNPHPRDYGTFPRVLGRFVREEKWLTLPEAIKKMTSLPAARLKLKDRGTIAVGMKADLMIFDPATIIDRSTFEQPRLRPRGIYRVFVNGTPVWTGDSPENERPGVVLLPR